ncbi:hypothetical protein Tco_0107267, partial [Tanacetum coccineum]
VDVKLKDTIVVAMSKLVGEGFYTCITRCEYEWKPPKYDEGKPLENVDSASDHDSDDEVELVDNKMTSFLASKKVGYGQEIPNNIQSICDNLDLKVRGRKKK